MNFWERYDQCNAQNGANRKNPQNNAENSKKDDINATCSEQSVRDRMAQYEGKSEDELMRELMSMAARMKNDGTFDAAAMENLFATASPFLNDEQRRRMRSIIDMLKG